MKRMARFSSAHAISSRKSRVVTIRNRLGCMCSSLHSSILRRLFQFIGDALAYRCILYEFSEKPINYLERIPWVRNKKVIKKTRKSRLWVRKKKRRQRNPRKILRVNKENIAFLQPFISNETCSIRSSTVSGKWPPITGGHWMTDFKGWSAVHKPVSAS